LVSRAALRDADPAAAGAGRALLVVDDADAALIRVLELLAPPPSAAARKGVHAGAHVDATARVAPSAEVGPGAVVGARTRVGDGAVLKAGVILGADVVVGAGCVLHPGVIVQDRCTLGDHVVLHPGVVIGADGFGYRPAPDGRGVVKIPHIGNVEI